MHYKYSRGKNTENESGQTRTVSMLYFLYIDFSSARWRLAAKSHILISVDYEKVQTSSVDNRNFHEVQNDIGRILLSPGE
jgi:hypothetical protein